MKKIFWFVFFALFIFLLSFFLLYRLNDVKGSQQKSKIITTDSEWALGFYENVKIQEGSLEMETLNFSKLDLYAIYEEDNDAVQVDNDEAHKQLLIDGDLLTIWELEEDPNPPHEDWSWWKIDLKQEFNLGKFRIHHSSFPGNMILKTSLDGLSYNDHGFISTIEEEGWLSKIISSEARFIKLQFDSGPGVPGGNLGEFEIYKIPQATHTTAPTQIEAPDTLTSWDSFTPTQTTPENTKIEYQFRVSTDASNWTDWTDKQEFSGGSIDLSSLPTEDGNGNKYKYLQIKATLTTYDSNVSPQIDEYQIQYSYDDVCSDVDHTEIKLSSEPTASYGQNRTIFLAPSQAGSTLTINSRAVDNTQGEVSGVTFSYSSDSCVKLSDNQFRAPPEGGSCTITSTSSCSNITTLTIKVNSFVPPPPSCSYGLITSAEIGPKTLTLSPGETQTLKVVFKDKEGKVVDPDNIPGFLLVEDYQQSFWKISKGGGTLSNEDKDNFTIKFTAGATPGTFTDTISFSACGAELKATATVIVVEEVDQFIKVVIDPEEVFLEPGKQAVFWAKAYDSEGKEITDKTTFAWSLTDERVGEIVSTDGAKLTFRASSNEGFYQFALKVVGDYKEASNSAYADVFVDRLNSRTQLVLRPNFYQINTYLDEGVKIEFYSTIISPKAKVIVPYSKQPVSIELLDTEAAKILKRGDNWIIVKPLKEGCFPNIVKGEINWFGVKYTAYAGFNVSSKDPFSPFAGYKPEITQIILSRKHRLKNTSSRLEVKFFDDSGHCYPSESPFYSISSTGDLEPIKYSFRFVLNDSSLGSLYGGDILGVSEKASSGKHKNALTLIFKFRGQEKTETWDIYAEDSYKDWGIADLPSQLKVPPGAIVYLRNFLGYYKNDWKDYIDGFYTISVNKGVESLQCCEPFFRVGNTEGVYEKAITLSSIFSEETKDIDVIVSSQIEMDKCKGFFIGEEEEESGGEEEDRNIQTPIIGHFLPQVTGAIKTLFLSPFNWLFPLLSVLMTFPLFLTPWWQIGWRGLVSTFSQWFLPGIPLRAKQKKKGIVYNYRTKKPLPWAKVQVFSYADKKLVFQTLSNAQGEFVLRLPEGTYYLRVSKKGFKPLDFVSFRLQSTYAPGRTDGYYDNIYYPEEIFSVKKSEGALELSLPLVSGQETAKASFWQRLKEWLAKYSFVFFVVGSLFSFLMFLFQPNDLYNQLVLFYYLVLWTLIVYRWVFYQPAKFLVVDNKGQPLDLVLCRVVDFKGNLVGVAVSDQKGMLNIQLSSGKYILKFKKPGYKANDMPLTIHSLATLGEVKVRMEKVEG